MKNILFILLFLLILCSGYFWLKDGSPGKSRSRGGSDFSIKNKPKFFYDTNFIILKDSLKIKINDTVKSFFIKENYKDLKAPFVKKFYIDGNKIYLCDAKNKFSIFFNVKKMKFSTFIKKIKTTALRRSSFLVFEIDVF